jgi:hypothetical protein
VASEHSNLSLKQSYWAKRYNNMHLLSGTQPSVSEHAADLNLPDTSDPDPLSTVLSSLFRKARGEFASNNEPSGDSARQPQSSNPKVTLPQGFCAGSAGNVDTGVSACAMDPPPTMTSNSCLDSLAADSGGAEAFKVVKAITEGGVERLEFELQEDLSVWAEDSHDKAGNAAASAARAHICAAFADRNAASRDVKRTGEDKGKQKRGSGSWSEGTAGCKHKVVRGGRSLHKQVTKGAHMHGNWQEKEQDGSSEGHTSSGNNLPLQLSVFVLVFCEQTPFANGGTLLNDVYVHVM